MQQTRAADAAYAIVSLTYNQSLMMLAGTIFGLLTLVAAFAAVLYAKRAAEAAELDLANTKDTSKRELRAYVVGKDATAFNVTAGKRPAFMIKLHNSGQTPAYDVRCITNIFAITGDVDTEKLLFRSRKAAQMSRDIIGGNDYKTLVNPAIGDFGQDSLGLVHAGHIKLIFCGIISYRDIFDRRHLSTFRTFIQLSGDPGMARIDMTSCAKGNSGN